MKYFTAILALLTLTLSTLSSQAETTPKPLNRGLTAINANGGVLVSWRARKSDNNVRYVVKRGTAYVGSTTTEGKRGLTTKTNILDTKGTTSNKYSLFVYDCATGALIDSQEDVPAWKGSDFGTQTLSFPIEAPTDPTSAKATYTPNDASYCDMDGDGEYEIILKWSPSNEKDAASSGTTSPAFYGCYKLDGTRLWMICTGANMFNSAHTTPFIAWDLNGDGYGEFLVKTAPGCTDGKGKYVLLGNDSPTANLKNSNGKQVSGSEYLTVFDGRTGAEIHTIPYHTNYATGANYWGDSKQNRSERYTACLAYLDGEDKNPSAIFNRGYYKGAFVGAYDFDGEKLTQRWVHRGYSASNGVVEYADGTKKTITKTVYGEGAHWLTAADLDGDGKHEIQFGSAAIDHDGTCLYRTGLGHGDSFHIGDFTPDNNGLEVFMVHEASPYGMDLRDAKTGKLLLHITASGDTGRGIIGHFDPSKTDAQWQFSAGAQLYDTKGNVVNSSVTHGGGGSLNCRLYWNGDLYEEFFDKSVMESYNNGLNRIQINGSNYFPGTLNNSTKYNPCVLGDIIGDYREEMVTWTGDAASGFKLLITTTNFPTENMLPHLMDDIQYREAVVSQNAAYNQPPHLSYDPATLRTIKGKTMKKSGSKGTWTVVYAPYPVVKPSNVKFYSVSSLPDKNVDSLKYTNFSGANFSGASLLVYAPEETEFELRPAGSSATLTTVSGNRLNVAAVDSAVCTQTTIYNYYELRDGDRGFGAYMLDASAKLKAGTPWIFLSKTSYTQEFFALSPDDSITAITETEAVDPQTSVSTYDISGRKANNINKGIIIKNKKKIIR